MFFLLQDHLGEFDLRMMISLIIYCFGTILNGFGRTPLNTGKTLFTVLIPSRFIILHTDIIGDADLFTNPAFITFFINIKFFIHRWNLLKGKFI